MGVMLCGCSYAWSCYLNITQIFLSRPWLLIIPWKTQCKQIERTVYGFCKSFVTQGTYSVSCCLIWLIIRMVVEGCVSLLLSPSLSNERNYRQFFQGFWTSLFFGSFAGYGALFLVQLKFCKFPANVGPAKSWAAFSISVQSYLPEIVQAFLVPACP